jgi:hypothetical protein
MALMGAGAFTIALAVLVPAAIAPALEKAPAKEDLTTHSRSAAKILNSATGQMEDITVDLTRVISPAVDGKGGYLGSSDVGVYHELLSLARVGADGDVQAVDARGRYTGLRAGESTIAFDRSTGVGKLNVYGETWHTTGQTVKFPFGTKKQTYQYFDQTSKRAWPVSYTATTKVKGLEVYVFKGSIPETSLGQYGVLTGTDTLYSNTGRTVYVEPVTGSIVSSETAPQTSIKFADGKVSPALLVENLVPTDATIANRVDAAKGDKSKVQMLQRAPYVLGALGLLLLVGGLYLYLSRRRTVVQPGQHAARPDVSGKLPTPRSEPAVDPARSRH